jgi:phosphoribosylformylglycinamidine synthase
MKARIAITLKNGVLDPQGKAIHSALVNQGFHDVTDVRQGKIIDIELKTSNSEQARLDIEAMCQKLLANTVIENYTILDIV